MAAKERNPRSSWRITAQSQAKSVKYKWQQGTFARKAKELFMVNAQDVTYEPLQGPSHIRILTLEPGPSPASIIRCSMRHVDLRDRPEYTALSYTWKLDHTLISASYAMAKSYAKTFLHGGEPHIEIPQDTGDLKASKEIICNGKVTKIYPNLYNALVQLRRKRAGDYWIDALCINQSDENEKAVQVQFMGQIYKSASQVVVWLGATGADLTDSVAYLDYLTIHTLDLPPIPLGKMVDIVEETDERLVPYKAMGVAISIIMSQWFRRTWVVQELCWAKEVVFMKENEEISIQCVGKAFNVAQSSITAMMKDPEDRDPIWGKLASVMKSLGRPWAPQFLHVSVFEGPKTLEARETFQQGDKWTIRQWLMICRGRLATDPRDMVFAGLSLIRPDLLIIDQSLQCSEPVPLRDNSALPFLLRKYYPQVIPLAGLKQSGRPGRRDRTSLILQSSPVLPKGLWPKLYADYKASVPEVLVNTAACILTHSGTEEILSLAARTSRPDKFASGWWVVPGDQLAKGKAPGDQRAEGKALDHQLAVERLPSWVPAPGSWASDVTEIEAVHRQSGPRAGVPITSRPKISHDGSALSLSVSIVDVIDHFYLGDITGGFWDSDGWDSDGWDSDGSKSFEIMLATLVKHRRQLSLTAVSQLLFGTNTQQYPHVSGDQNMWILHELSHSACAEIAHSRTNQLHKRPRRFDYPKKSADQFARFFGISDKEEGTRADEISSLFTKVKAAYPDENWPKWADPLQFDMEIHKSFLRQLAESSSTGSGSDPENVGQGGSTSDSSKSQLRHSVIVSDKVQAPASGARATENRRNSQEKALLSKLKLQDPARYARLTALVQSRLSWRKIFITRRGFLGMGPSWLHIGDTVMLVQGASAPYAFTPLHTDLHRREKDVRDAMDNNQKKYNEIVKTMQTEEKKNAYLHPIDNVVHSHQQRKLNRLDEEEETLSCKLDRISTTPPWLNAWVLQGEVSIESTLERQATERETWERITII
ncbi:heterokaryon incompatibility protein-domain-containing protein [Phaeosphaeria sp. MPI-PUGE-AT-0046c]|nr:heterokaryon incompatibility protein-domain-containing protein [Phaeosphaeria sp. MPI-PUGE-AT-0046c]